MIRDCEGGVGRHGFLLSFLWAGLSLPDAEKPRRWRGFFFLYPISLVYQVAGGKSAKYLWGYWLVSGCKSGTTLPYRAQKA